MINKSKQRLNAIRLVEIANNKDKVSKILVLIKSKVNQLNKSEFQDFFIRFRVCKAVQDNYFNQIKDTLRSVKIAEKKNVLNNHKSILGDKLQQSIKDFYKSISQPFSDKTSFKTECMEKFFKDSYEYYERKFKKDHKTCMNLIEEERKVMQNTINMIIKNVEMYNSKIIDRFSSEAYSADRRFYNNVARVYYDLYVDNFYNTVIVSQYDLISTNAIRSSIYSSAYYECPDCGSIWEMRIETDLRNYIGKGQFRCSGITLGCNSKMFVTDLRQVNQNLKTAKKLDIISVMTKCDTEMNMMKNYALDYLKQNLHKRY